MRAQRERVLVCAADGILFCNIFGSDAHGRVGRRVLFRQVRVRFEPPAAARERAHGLHAAGDEHFAEAGHNALRGQRNRLQARGTETIDGLAGHLKWQTGALANDPGHLVALLALGRGAANYDVLDLFWVQTRRAPDGLVDDGCAHVFRSVLAQLSGWRLADGGAGGRDNDGFFHWETPRT